MRLIAPFRQIQGGSAQLLRNLLLIIIIYYLAVSLKLRLTREARTLTFEEIEEIVVCLCLSARLQKHGDGL